MSKRKSRHEPLPRRTEIIDSATGIKAVRLQDGSVALYDATYDALRTQSQRKTDTTTSVTAVDTGPVDVSHRPIIPMLAPGSWKSNVADDVSAAPVLAISDMPRIIQPALDPLLAIQDYMLTNIGDPDEMQQQAKRPRLRFDLATASPSTPLVGSIDTSTAPRSSRMRFTQRQEAVLAEGRKMWKFEAVFEAPTTRDGERPKTSAISRLSSFLSADHADASRDN